MSGPTQNDVFISNTLKSRLTEAMFVEEKEMHVKKMIAPVVITAIMVLYYIGFAYACLFWDGIPLLGKILGGVIPALLAGVSIYVLVERIREIRSGEEDDLSKY